MEPITESTFLDQQFSSSESMFGADLQAYCNHCYRVLNFAVALAPVEADARHKIEIACYFHDLGIWSDATFDYLAPSAARARSYLGERDLSAWDDEVTRMISEHHKLTRTPRDDSLVEVFRKADSVDLSLGMLRSGLDRRFVAAVRRAFPNCGFHRRLAVLTAQRVRRHPLSPLPMFKW